MAVGNSYLDFFLKYSKTTRIHAAFHDATSHCKSCYDKVPGYSYVFSFPINSCLLGHLSARIQI